MLEAYIIQTYDIVTQEAQEPADRWERWVKAWLDYCAAIN